MEAFIHAVRRLLSELKYACNLNNNSRYTLCKMPIEICILIVDKNTCLSALWYMIHEAL